VKISRTRQLRDLIDAREILVRPGVAIAIHAQIAQALGYRAVGVSGANMASHVLGLPDAGLITMTEAVENVRRVAAAVSIPVIADCDTGFGNAINVRRTVSEMVRAGAAGLFFEDQVAPKRCGFVAGKELIPAEEMVGKLRAAVDARDELDPDFVIIARTDARTAVGGGIDEVKRRAQLYRGAGADMIYVEALQSNAEIQDIRTAFEGPYTCTFRGIKEQPTLEQLEEWGVSMTVASMFFKVGLVAMWDLLAEMKDRGLAPYNEMLDRTEHHPMGNFGTFDLTGFPQILEWERKYLSEEAMKKYETSSGIYDPRVGHSAGIRLKS
jgi:2-methylisocitrate lyase-like PEP mutase family enzyme